MSGNSSPRVGNDFVVARPQPRPARITYRPSPAPVAHLAAPALSLEMSALPTFDRHRQYRPFDRLGEVFDTHTLLIFILLSALIVGLASQVGMSYWNNHLLAVSSEQTATTVLQSAHLSADKLMLTLPASSASERLHVISSRAITISAADNLLTPDQAMIRSWLSTTASGNRATISVNSAAIAASVQSLTSKLVTPVIDEVTTDHGGSTAPQQIITGKNGTELVNTAAVTQQIATQLLKGQGVITVTADIKPVAFHSVTPAAFDKLLEADVTTKTLYAYQNGQLVQTFPASTGKASTPTPLGEFHIWSKLAKRTMRGPGYVQPNVPYVSYFDHSGDAVHGVYWRPASVFGAINTSHGCVGLKVDQAKWVYDWAPIGTTIINHR